MTTSTARAATGTALFSEKAEAWRRRVLRRWGFRAYLLGRLPLAAAAGLRLVRLDEGECVVSLPGGWRTRNPFGSTYFAAQAMAAEMSTGAPAMVLVRGAAASVAFILVGLRGDFSRRISGPSTYTFSDVAALAAAIRRAEAGPDPVTYVARSVARGADGTPCSEFEVTWSFKRRA